MQISYVRRLTRFLPFASVSITASRQRGRTTPSIGTVSFSREWREARGGVPLHHPERLDDRPMQRVVGAELQRVEQGRDYAAVVPRVGAADRGAQALLVHRPGLPFANQVVQGLLAGDREDDLAHGVVGPLDRGVGDLIEEIGLTRDLPELVDDLQLDPTLSTGADGVDRFDQKLD